VPSQPVENTKDKSRDDQIESNDVKEGGQQEQAVEKTEKDNSKLLEILKRENTNY
jgi:hypothetical protein